MDTQLNIEKTANETHATVRETEGTVKETDATVEVIFQVRSYLRETRSRLT